MLAPPPPTVGRGSGGLVLLEETAAHETTISHSGICVRPSDNRIRQLAASRRGPKASTLLYMTRRELIVREREVEGHHAVTKVDTLENIADLLTKALDPTPYEKLRRMLLNVLAVGAIYPVPRARRIAAKAASTSD